MPNLTVLISHWLPDGELHRWQSEFPDIDFTQDPAALDRADIAFGLPDLARLGSAVKLRWIQLASAGVPAALCAPAKASQMRVTNLAGLYGPTIAEHTFAMLLSLARNFKAVHRNQNVGAWDRSVMSSMRDLTGSTLAVVGLGNIGCHIAKLAKAFGMRVIGCKRTAKPCPFADRVYPTSELRAMFADADHVAIAAPLTPQTTGMVGMDALQALKHGSLLVNVSRGPIVQEEALLEALRSGPLFAAGLDVFAVEPLPTDHPFWSMPNVLVSPHYSGETVNTSDLPARRFTRNLRAYLANQPQEGVVDLDSGY